MSPQRSFADSNHKFFNQIVLVLSQPAITCSKLTIETLDQGVKDVQSSQ